MYIHVVVSHLLSRNYRSHLRVMCRGESRENLKEKTTKQINQQPFATSVYPVKQVSPAK